MLPRESSTDDNTLQRFSHVQPGTRKGRIKGQNTVLEEPAHHFVTPMACQVIPDENEAESRRSSGIFIGPPLLPGKHQGMIVWQRNALLKGLGVQLGQDGLQLLLQPRVQDHIGSRQNPFRLDLTGRRTKEGQELGGASTYILVRQSSWFAFWVPGFSWVSNSLIGTSLILTPEW